MVGVAVNFKKYIWLIDLTKSIIFKLSMEVKWTLKEVFTKS